MILIICDRRYNALQFWNSLRILKRRGHAFEVVSSSLQIMPEDNSQHVSQIRNTIHTVDPSQFAALMFISGHPKDTRSYWRDSTVSRIVQEFKGKPAAAICAAVPSIRYLCKGHEVTCYPSQDVRDMLVVAGATLVDVTVCVDGPIVTAENEQATDTWVNAFADVLEGKTPVLPYNTVNFRSMLRAKPRRLRPGEARIQGDE
jgi:putative intracellular protease/amidase